MKHQTMPALVVFLFALLGTGKSNSPIDFIDDSNNQFALDVYKDILNSTGNIIASPVSLKIVLALVRLGAEGDTAAEISNVLHHPRDDVRLLDGYKAMITELEKPFLKMAFKVFVENSSKIYPDFQNVATAYFLSNIQGVNFKRDPEGSRKQINSWVESNTNNKIKNLFIKGSLSRVTRLVLVNAIHFKAKWLHQFNEKKTRDAPFYMTPNKTVNVSMMSLSEKNLLYKNSKSLGARIIELPYKETGFRMIMILPHDIDGLSKVEHRLVSSNIFTLLRGLRSIIADVQMPRFKIEKNLDLEIILKKLGMIKAFTDLAEFSKISNESLRIDKVVQKALIEVNEEGTEAAAASGIEIVQESAYMVEMIRFDRPFMFLIMKDSTILFMGRFSNPE